MASDSGLRGPIAWMARNTVAANLLMIVILLGGAWGLSQVKQEVFPAFDLDVVTVQVAYPGAGPEEVEQGVVLPVEEAVRGLDGVKRVNAVATDGVALVSVELLIDADPDRVLSDVKSEVDRIRTFPEEIEEPQVSLATQRREVISLVLAGPVETRTLHELAEDVRLDLLATGEITQAEVQGVPPVEVAIEVPRETLQKYGLTLDDVARQVQLASLELPGGDIETEVREYSVRVSDRRLRGHEFADIVVRGTAQGGAVRLGDIAAITDGYEDTDQASYFDGEPAVRVVAYRVGDETPDGVATAVKEHAETLRAELPSHLTLATWDDDSKILQDRINLLARNAAIGLVLVILVLSLFLDLRLAFWTMLGIPISFFGAFFLMPGLDLSINMITLFALIVTLGIVVDDAIVVGENVFHAMEKGSRPIQAAVEGAREMVVPVTFAILTSIAAFSPMFFVPGTMGKVFVYLPAVVVIVLLFSLVEAFFILPAHLSHEAGFWERMSWVNRPSDWVGRQLERFQQGPFAGAVDRVVEYRYLALAGATFAFAITVGAVASGLVPYHFFPALEGNVVTAAVRLPAGSPLSSTLRVREDLEQAAREAVQRTGGPAIRQGMYTMVGQGPPQGGPGGGQQATGSHLLTVQVQLVPTDEREASAEEFAAAWSDAMPSLAVVDSISFESTAGPGAGAAVEVQLAHEDIEVLAEASDRVEQVLRGYGDLTDIQNSYTAGQPLIDFHLTDHARTLGLTGSDVARQIRSSFYGAEAAREQRDRSEMRVMTRLPAHQRQSLDDLDELRIRTPQGFVPLEYVADREEISAPTDIEREDGRRIVEVSGALAPGVDSPRQVITDLRESVFPDLQRQYPDLSIDMAGQQREQREAMSALAMNYGLALVVMYALLAIPFRSYAQPFVVMAAIPLGFVGAVLGHVLMGYTLTLISAFGVVALSGVVVNDSLILIDTANRQRAAGESAFDAITYAARRRLRPILLTSLTTFFGLAPMIFETSIQARFLIPMALSLGFGILVATGIILLVVPALYMANEDVLGLGRRLLGRAAETVPTPEASSQGSRPR